MPIIENNIQLNFLLISYTLEQFITKISTFHEMLELDIHLYTKNNQT